MHKAKDTDKHEHFIKHLVYILTVTSWRTRLRLLCLRRVPNFTLVLFTVALLMSGSSSLRASLQLQPTYGCLGQRSGLPHLARFTTVLRHEVWRQGVARHATFMAPGWFGWCSVRQSGPLSSSSGVMTRADVKALQALEVMKSCHDFDSIVSLESLATIRKRYSIPDEYILHVPGPGQRPYHPCPEGFSISIDALEARLRFPLHPVIG
ncbi:hypothetical protein BHM03_00051768 [Ensete ventricosum]|nr:hypothetical protein BHM03_00051768 [Ensete ventricosum]